MFIPRAAWRDGTDRSTTVASTLVPRRPTHSVGRTRAIPGRRP